MSVPSWAQPYIDTINGTNWGQFFWGSATGSPDPTYPSAGFFATPSDYAWYWWPVNSRPDNRSIIASNYRTNEFCYPSNDFRIDVTTNDNIYTCSFSPSFVTGLFVSWNGAISNGGYFEYNNSGTLINIFGGNNAQLTDHSYSVSGTGEQVLAYIAQFCRHIDLYVDGELWTQASPISYQWQSVPSISGKNGILSLAQIKEEYINDGESVSGASADHFINLSTGNRVDVLIDDALPAPEIGGTTVTVKYTIPTLSSGSYEYCKLVAKKNSMPEGPEDGDKIINIDPTSISASVKYLRGSTKYYFEIFVKTTDGYEAVSNVKSITTGETHDIVLFTDEFNTEILKSGWALDVYKSMFSNGSTGWAPTSFTSDFLSSYNFLCGNASRRPLSMSNGELLTANGTGTTDQTFWIPIERSYINESIIVSFDGKISPLGRSSSYYNYIRVWLAYVDDNNAWHSYDACGDIVTDQQWHTFEHEVQPQFPYIDYIGLCCCDGSSHWKNVKVINS